MSQTATQNPTGGGRASDHLDEIGKALAAVKGFQDSLPQEQRLAINDLIEAFQAELAEQHSEIEELEQDKETDETLIDVVNRVLDCVDRPTGTLNCSMPRTAESSRALLALFDAAGRKL